MKSATRPCLTTACVGLRNPGHFCCIACWHLLPAWLRDKCIAERSACRLAGIRHSQELFALRDRAMKILNHTDRQPAPPERSAHA